MKEIIQDILYMIEKISEYQKKNIDIIANEKIILDLINKLQRYTDKCFMNVNNQKNEIFNIWIEMLTDCMNGIENRDNILLIDTLKYGIKPFINNIKEELYSGKESI